MSDAVRAKIKDLEDEIGRTQKNKATMSHLCRLKARVAQLKRELIAPKGGGGGKGEGFDVSKTGDARIGMIGFPSVGKSTLLTRLTGTYSVSAEYEFTTLKTVPGVLRYKGAKLQVLDLPGIIEGANDGKGRGRQVIAVGRSCDVILICLDILKPLGHKRIIEKEVEGMGIRLNGREKRIKFTRTDKGGVQFSYRLKSGETPTHLDQEIVKSVCAEYKIHCADVRIAEDCTVDDLIDVIEGNRRYIPAIYVLNKIDQITIEELDICYKLPHCVPISAYNMWNFDALLQKIWDYLDLIRIYTKPKGTIPDYSDPVILKKDASVEDFCTKIHKTLLNDFKYALVWGESAKHVPQKVGLGHVLMDEDIVQIVKRV